MRKTRDPGKRAEALALRGRNQKTRWRQEFEALPDLAERRRRATSQLLRRAYEAYREAYLHDLDHHWSGLAAVQLGMIALDLSRDEPWYDAFRSDQEAEAYAKLLKTQVDELLPTVGVAVKGSLRSLPDNGREKVTKRIWAEVTSADLFFLTEARVSRVVNAYRDAVPRDEFFVWNAVKGQLSLFQALGFKADLAGAVMTALDAHIPPRPQAERHVIIVAGHRLDEPVRPEPRFPPAAIDRARELIEGKLNGFEAQGVPIEVLASAAPGTDILCHQICRDNQIKSLICLPVPKDDFCRLAFGGLDTWRSAYLDLVRDRPVLELSDREGLPRWLAGRDVDPWERGNQWVLEIARSSGAKKVTLVALWDGKPTGSARGGTAHMVQIARDAGDIDIVIIEAAQLIQP